MSSKKQSNLPIAQMKQTPFKRFLHSFVGYKKEWQLVLMFLPVIITYLIFKYYPMYGVTIAFKDFSIKKGIMGSDWVGLKHFERMFLQNDTFLRALRNTVIIAGLKMLVGFPAPIILALLINEVRNLKFKKVVQTISYLPHFISWIILTGIFTKMLSIHGGAVNNILAVFGVEPILFMGDNKWFRTVLILTNLWKGVGWGTIVYLAAITGISPELYEAAEMDGATRFQKMFKITVPMIAPTIAVIFILNSGSILEAGFDQVFNMYNSSVLETADIIDTYVYRIGLTKMDYETGAAAGLFKNLVGMILVLITNAVAKKLDENGGIW